MLLEVISLLFFEFPGQLPETPFDIMVLASAMQVNAMEGESDAVSSRLLDAKLVVGAFEETRIEICNRIAKGSTLPPYNDILKVIMQLESALHSFGRKHTIGTKVALAYASDVFYTLMCEVIAEFTSLEMLE